MCEVMSIFLNHTSDGVKVNSALLWIGLEFFLQVTLNVFILLNLNCCESAKKHILLPNRNISDDIIIILKWSHSLGC